MVYDEDVETINFSNWNGGGCVDNVGSVDNVGDVDVGGSDVAVVGAKPSKVYWFQAVWPKLSTLGWGNWLVVAIPGTDKLRFMERSNM